MPHSTQFGHTVPVCPIHHGAMNRSRIAQIAFLTLVLGLLLVAMVIVNHRFSLMSPGGNDFVPRYVGTRLMLDEGISPYSEKATTEIQKVIYGRPAQAGEDENLFVYPLYSTVVFAPFSLIDDYVLARALWMTLLQVALVATVLVGLQLADWRPHWTIAAALTMFGLLWYHSARPLINGNAAILCGLFIVVAMLAIRKEHDVLAGPLVALATIKPQVVVLWFPWVILWAASKRRWRLVGSTLISLAALVLGTSLIVPDWLLSNYRQIAAYPTYTLPGTPSGIFSQWWPEIGPWLGFGVTLFTGVLLVVQWRRAWASSFAMFLWTAYLTLAVTTLTGIRTATANYVVLLPALILVLASLAQKYPNASAGLTWFILISLLVGLWALFLVTLVGNRQSAIMFFPVPLLLLLAMLVLEPLDNKASAPPGQLLSEPL
jgi:hypothetical protein